MSEKKTCPLMSRAGYGRAQCEEEKCALYHKGYKMCSFKVRAVIAELEYQRE